MKGEERRCSGSHVHASGAEEEQRRRTKSVRTGEEGEKEQGFFCEYLEMPEEG